MIVGRGCCGSRMVKLNAVPRELFNVGAVRWFIPGAVPGRQDFDEDLTLEEVACGELWVTAARRGKGSSGGPMVGGEEMLLAGLKAPGLLALVVRR